MPKLTACDPNLTRTQRALRTRTTTLFLLGSVLHATAFISSNYYVPVYLQGVRGVDALHSGIQLLPYSILVAVLTSTSSSADHSDDS